MAPAITLNRMYHCVPKQQQHDRTDAEPPAETDQQQQHHGKQRGSGNGGGDLSQRLRDAGQFGIEADGDAGGNRPQRSQQ